jgi:hypothetical protein
MRPLQVLFNLKKKKLLTPEFIEPTDALLFAFDFFEGDTNTFAELVEWCYELKINNTKLESLDYLLYEQFKKESPETLTEWINLGMYPVFFRFKADFNFLAKHRTRKEIRFLRKYLFKTELDCFNVLLKSVTMLKEICLICFDGYLKGGEIPSIHADALKVMPVNASPKVFADIWLQDFMSKNKKL